MSLRVIYGGRRVTQQIKIHILTVNNHLQRQSFVWRGRIIHNERRPPTEVGTYPETDLAKR